MNKLKNVDNVIVYNQPSDINHYAPVLSFNVGDVHSEKVAYMLNRGGVAVRGGFHCSPLAHKFMGTDSIGAVRISPSFVNTKKEINIMLNLVEKIAI